MLARNRRGPGMGHGNDKKGRHAIQPGAGSQGICICPACGHTEAHQQGLPCNHLKCAHCGAPMRRE